MRLLFTTIELMKNRNLGQHGALEMLISPGQGGPLSRHTWNLDDNEKLSADQLRDVGLVLEEAVMKELVIRLHAPVSLFDDLTG
jgi:hypothetical protein